MDIIKWIQDWYKGQCDGCWEHMYGVKIDNIDNPGWIVKIDLFETELEEKQFDKIQHNNGDDDWLLCFVKDGIFDGSGDVDKLEKILHIFKNWVES